MRVIDPGCPLVKCSWASYSAPAMSNPVAILSNLVDRLDQVVVERSVQFEYVRVEAALGDAIPHPVREFLQGRMLEPGDLRFHAVPDMVSYDRLEDRKEHEDGDITLARKKVTYEPKAPASAFRRGPFIHSLALGLV